MELIFFVVVYPGDWNITCLMFIEEFENSNFEKQANMVKNRPFWVKNWCKTTKLLKCVDLFWYLYFPMNEILLVWPFSKGLRTVILKKRQKQSKIGHFRSKIGKKWQNFSREMIFFGGCTSRWLKYYLFDVYWRVWEQ